MESKNIKISEETYLLLKEDGTARISQATWNGKDCVQIFLSKEEVVGLVNQLKEVSE